MIQFESGLTRPGGCQCKVPTVVAGLNFTLETAIGDIDVLGEITGLGGYGNLIQTAVEREVFDARCSCIGLEQLIAAKRAAGRPKDLEVIAELELLLEEQTNASVR